jgi:hypothetical protein
MSYWGHIGEFGDLVDKLPSHFARSGAASRAVSSKPLRNVLLGTVAAGVLAFGYGRRGNAYSVSPSAYCDVVAAQVTCSGDLSEGVYVDGAGVLDYLRVYDLEHNIAPGIGDDGIQFVSSGNVEIVVEGSETYKIVTTGSGGEGIFGRSENGNVKITNDLDIEMFGTDSEGIRARVDGDGTIDIDNTANIFSFGSSSPGIFARTSGTGSITVSNSGAVTTNASDAIQIESAGGYVYVNNDGNLTTAGNGSDGILVSQDDGGGDIYVKSNGTITSNGENGNGIFVRKIGGTSNTIEITVGGVVESLHA